MQWDGWDTDTGWFDPLERDNSTEWEQYDEMISGMMTLMSTARILTTSRCVVVLASKAWILERSTPPPSF